MWRPDFLLRHFLDPVLIGNLFTDGHSHLPVIAGSMYVSFTPLPYVSVFAQSSGRPEQTQQTLDCREMGRFNFR